MFEFAKSDALTPGTWKPLLWDGRNTARITCPKCGRTSVLPHAVAADGTVTPSVVCAYSAVVECPHERCDFHDMARLLNWADPPPPAPRERSEP